MLSTYAIVHRVSSRTKDTPTFFIVIGHMAGKWIDMAINDMNVVNVRIGG